LNKSAITIAILSSGEFRTLRMEWQRILPAVKGVAAVAVFAA
jgi:hypothetical protein